MLLTGKFKGLTRRSYGLCNMTIFRIHRREHLQNSGLLHAGKLRSLLELDQSVGKSSQRSLDSAEIGVVIRIV